MVRVIYKNSDFIAVNKPAGLLVHAVKAHKTVEKTLVQWLLENFPEVAKVGDPSTGHSTLRVSGRSGSEEPSGSMNSMSSGQVERPGVVHRLDKDTSGVLIVARNQQFFDYLKNLFQTNQVKKTYLALVFGEVQKGGVIDKPIGLKPGTTKRSVMARNMKMIKSARTEYKPIKIFSAKGEFFTLLRIIPKTGRTHQIRVHLASIGHPVVGDALYSRKENPFGVKRQFLHAESIEFSKKSGERIKIEAALPEELKSFLQILESK